MRENARKGKKITIEKNKPVQSADTLFRLTNKIEYLIEIIEKDAISPRYVEEVVDYLDVGNKEIAYPMICFCDINLHKIGSHMEYYGKYGIGLSKEWGIEKGIQPIQYINEKSFVCRDFKEAFKGSLEKEKNDKTDDFLVTQMSFWKPIEGYMKLKENNVYKIFTDECEWRYVAKINDNDSHQVVVMDKNLNIGSLKVLNEVLKGKTNHHLKYNLEDVNYIIIKNEKDFEKITEVIEKKNIDSIMKNKLISKIIIWDEVKGDL